MISNCGIDERGKISGGAAGDQTGKEYWVRSWYNFGANVVLRAPDRNVGTRLADVSRLAAENNNVGYDQGERLTYYNALKAVGWHPEKIAAKCEADCSSSTSANIIATGQQLGNDRLCSFLPNSTTRNLRARLVAVGFTELTASKYLSSDAYLEPGDIILHEGSHVAINLDWGKYAARPATDTKNKIATDGIWGYETTRRAQQFFGTIIDGEVWNQPSTMKKYLPACMAADKKSWKFSILRSGGSAMVGAMQKWCGLKETKYIDVSTIKAFQKKISVSQTGKLDFATVKAWQTYLNTV